MGADNNATRSQRRFAAGEEGASTSSSRATSALNAPSDAAGHYAALGLVSAEARCVDTTTLHAAFRRTVLACHPDTAPPGAAPDFARRFRRAMDAWEVLREPAKRKRYDEHGHA